MDERAAYMPPGWMVPVRGAETAPVRKDTSKNTRHYEFRHYADGHTLDMKKQEDLGLMPPPWSVTSAMKDERPNGKPQFDSRFLNTPMGRARAGRSIVWDPRGTMNSGGTQRLENIDITQVMAQKYAEMTNKAAESAYFAEYYDGVNTLGDDGANAQIDLQLAQMSKLQKKQIDKDGDGNVSLAEMEAQGFAFGMHNKSGSDGLISDADGDGKVDDATFVDLAQRGGHNSNWGSR